MKKTTSFLIFILCFVQYLICYENNNFQHERLSNGLEVFTLENPSTPLVYIEIAVRAGGISQTQETAGLFHLYEHMMFKGNEKYQTAAAVQNALAKMGVGTWNGSTAAEYVNYYFTIPSSLLKEGLEFWSYAIRYPLLQEEELETEKKVVLSEIEGGYGEPHKILGNAVYTYLFKDYPWRLDPGGTLTAIQNATISQLRDIQENYYIPSNVGLFIGGDITHKETMNLVKAIYGDWKNPEIISDAKVSPQNQNPFSMPSFFVQGNSTISSEIAEILIYYRGPDTKIDTKSTYPADIWSSLLKNPQGKFIKNFLGNTFLDIPSPEYLGGGYYTSGDAGRISFFGILLNPQNDIINRTYSFYTELTKNFSQMLESDYFSKQELELVKMRLQDDAIISMETTEGFLSQLRFWWAVTSTNYYLNYEKKMHKTSKHEINTFIREYLLEKNPMIILVVNDRFLETHKKQFLEENFTILTEENSYWWNTQK